MKIAQPQPVYLPRTLADAIATSASGPAGLPGLIVSTDALKGLSASLDRALQPGQVLAGAARSSYVVIKPDEIPLIFRHDKELDLLRSLVGAAVSDASPRLKIGIDAVWLVYGAFKLRDQWKRPDRNTAACLFEFAGLAANAAGLVGDAYPSLKMPDHFANGIDYFVIAGGAVVAGKAVPINEIMMSSDARMSIPLKALKVVGVSLDPDIASATTMVPLGSLRPGSASM